MLRPTVDGPPELERLVAAVMTDIRFGESARFTALARNVVPDRLDDRRGVWDPAYPLSAPDRQTAWWWRWRE